MKKYGYMNHRLNLMKDGVHRFRKKDGKFGHDKVSEVLKHMRNYTDKPGPMRPKQVALKSPRQASTGQDYQVDINQTMKIHRGFQTTAQDSRFDRSRPRRQKSISKAQESYQKRMQRNQLSKMIRPYVKTPEPKRSSQVNDGYRQSIEVASRRYYELRKSRPNGAGGDRQAMSHFHGGRSRSSNLWQIELQKISRDKSNRTGEAGAQNDGLSRKHSQKLGRRVTHQESGTQSELPVKYRSKRR